ncbi:MAG: hypothetical protein ABH878_08480, partial [bacterium]
HTITDALKRSETQIEESKRTFLDCERRLRKRWWPFGKKLVWIALVNAWSQIERQECLRLIGKIPSSNQQAVLTRLNNESPLTPDQWDFAYHQAGIVRGLLPVILEMLDSEEPKLHLSETLFEKIAAKILPDIHLADDETNPENTRKIEEKREKAWGRYLRLVHCTANSLPKAAQKMLELLFDATVKTERFKEKWPDRFAAIRNLINFWALCKGLRQTGLTYLESNTPAHLRDFCLAQWQGMVSDDDKEAEKNRDYLQQNCQDKAMSEAWFLVVLVKRGMAVPALQLARTSSRAKQLLPQLRRAWLCENPAAARVEISLSDLLDDIVGKFLHKATIQDRVELLRQETNNGELSPPSELWRLPNLNNLVLKTMDSDKPINPTRNALLNLYHKDEAPENQLKEYLRLHGYIEYGHEEVDPYVLSALVVWHEQHPKEVDSTLQRMWHVMKPNNDLLTLDVIRNAVFQRCQTIFAAYPAALDRLFISWVKTKLVDNQIRYQRGDTIYTYSLKEIVPFLYCLLSAQKVADFSSSRCDEIIKIALSKYIADEDLIKSAARLYASDKGLEALHPPVNLKDPAHEQAWQMGVVAAAVPRLLQELLEKHR